MQKVDARRQSREALLQRRQQVIRLRGEGVPVMQIVERTGLSWAAVNAAIRKYQAEGPLALKPAARGRKQGTGRALSEDQEAGIRQCIRTRRPQFYRLKKSLWDREAVKQLIEQKYGVDLSERVIGNYLSRWGLAPKNSKLHEPDRCSKDIRQWLERNYAEVVQKAQEGGAEIYWLRKPVRIDTDEWSPSSANKDTEAGMPASPKKKLSMVSVVTNQGKVRWAIIDGAFNAERQIKFVDALIRDTRKTLVFLIRSDWRTYDAQDFMWWIRENKQQVKIFPESQTE